MGILAADKQQTIEFTCDDQLGALADCFLLRQEVMNLLHNAIRYAPNRSRIALKGLARNGKAIIEVADEGPGIAWEHQEKIFERFYRIDKARSRAEGGTGLGLAIAKWSVERQGGTIELESETGKGSVFRILLPVAAS